MPWVRDAVDGRQLAKWDGSDTAGCIEGVRAEIGAAWRADRSPQSEVDGRQLTKRDGSNAAGCIEHVASASAIGAPRRTDPCPIGQTFTTVDSSGEDRLDAAGRVKGAPVSIATGSVWLTD